MPFAGWLKLFLKNVRWKKNKKHSYGQCVGLDTVLLYYRFYVFGHLSKWFTICLCFGCLFNVRSVVLPLAITIVYPHTCVYFSYKCKHYSDISTLSKGEMMAFFNPVIL